MEFRWDHRGFFLVLIRRSFVRLILSGFGNGDEFGACDSRLSIRRRRRDALPHRIRCSAIGSGSTSSLCADRSASERQQIGSHRSAQSGRKESDPGFGFLDLLIRNKNIAESECGDPAVRFLGTGAPRPADGPAWLAIVAPVTQPAVEGGCELIVTNRFPLSGRSVATRLRRGWCRLEGHAARPARGKHARRYPARPPCARSAGCLCQKQSCVLGGRRSPTHRKALAPFRAGRNRQRRRARWVKASMMVSRACSRRLWPRRSSTISRSRRVSKSVHSARSTSIYDRPIRGARAPRAVPSPNAQPLGGGLLFAGSGFRSRPASSSPPAPPRGARIVVSSRSSSISRRDRSRARRLDLRALQPVAPALCGQSDQRRRLHAHAVRFRNWISRSETLVRARTVLPPMTRFLCGGAVPGFHCASSSAIVCAPSGLPRGRRRRVARSDSSCEFKAF